MSTLTWLPHDSFVITHYSPAIDWVLDETSVLGAAMGLSQMGLTPIGEIPLANFLSCGCDMCEEIAMMHWLRNGQWCGTSF
jgi:pyruvate/2-oxoglutarate/acetoin dehydrogenase E1 component